MKRLTTLFAALALSAAFAQTPSDMTQAEVRKVDKDAGKITLKHGEIKNLGMPPMTMVFRVSDPGLLATLVAGDNIVFTADKVNGQFTVTSLEKPQKQTP